MKIARPALVKTLLGTPLAVYRSATLEERRDLDQMLRTILPISRRVAGIWNDGEVASNLTRYPLEEMRVPTLVISAADDLYDTYESGLHTDDRDALELQGIEQPQVSIGLCLWRRVGGKRSAEVAEARRGDDAVAVAEKRGAEVEPLIEAAARSMNEKDRRSVSRLAELDRAVRRVDERRSCT